MIYAINLAPDVSVCLHCGELNPDGALFCTKCGFTLPQVGGQPTPTAPPTAAPSPTATAPSPPPSVSGAVSHPTYSYPSPGGPSPYLVAAPPAAVGPIAPPPSGKYCVHCRTIISQAAVYCPVCQRPQA